jgi:hypothetical protein
MNDGFDYGIIALGLGGLAFIAGLGIWIWEIVSTFKNPQPSKGPCLQETAPLSQVLPITVLTQKNNQPPTTPNMPTKVIVEVPHQAPADLPRESEETKTTSWTNTSPSPNSPPTIHIEPVITPAPTTLITPLEQVSHKPKRTPPFPTLFAKLLKF